MICPHTADGWSMQILSILSARRVAMRGGPVWWLCRDWLLTLTVQKIAWYEMLHGASGVDGFSDANYAKEKRIILAQYKRVRQVVKALTKLRTHRGDFLFNPLNPELNPICYLLALLGDHYFLHVSRIRVNVEGTRLVLLFKYTWQHNCL